MAARSAMPVLANIAGDEIGGISSMMRYTVLRVALLALAVSLLTLAVD